MKPNPSVVMSIVVNTEVCKWVEGQRGGKTASPTEYVPRVWTCLVVYGIDDIDGLHAKDQPHARGDVGETSEPDALLAQTSDVEHEPQDETRSELVELFNVELGVARGSRVEGSTHEELYTSVQRQPRSSLHFELNEAAQ